jgi:O-antigen ligase
MRFYRLAALLCLVAFAASLLSAAGQLALESEYLRGWGGVLPAPIAHAGADAGVNVDLRGHDPARLAAVLDRLAAAHVVWLRQEFRWAEIEPAPEAYDWTAADRVIDAASARGLHVLAALVTTPDWARDAGTATAPPRDPALFARFARAFAARYGDRLATYQVWDEPNIAFGWGGLPIAPEDYAALLEAGYTAIHAADHDAVVVAAGLAPTVETGPANLSDVLFLRRLYETGAAPYFDVAAAKPYGFDTGPYDRPASPETLNFSRMVLLREVMEQHGDAAKALWASHLGWNALPPGWSGPPSIWGQVDEATQAAYTAGALERARLEWPWAGVLFFAAAEPPADPQDPFAGFALLDAAGQPRPALAALQQALTAPALAWPGWHAATPADFVQFDGTWRFSELGADVAEPAPGQPPDRATIHFYGTDFGLTVRRGPYRAHYYVTVDGQPANALPRDDQGAYLILTSPDGGTRVDTLPVARDLADGPHTAELTAERGWGQWALAGFSVGRAPEQSGARLRLALTAGFGLLALLGVVLLSRRADWPGALHAARARYLARGTALQTALTGLAAALFYATAWLAWGEELPALLRPATARLGDGGQIALLVIAAAVFYYSPWVPIALVALVALGLLVYYRLDLGLALAVFCAPFYLMPRVLFDNALAMTSVVIWLCGLAWLAQALLRWRRSLVVGAGRAGASPAPTALDLAVLAFLLVATASLPFSEFAREAAREYRTVVLEPVLLYALIRLVRLDRPALWRLADALVLSGVVVALIGLVQYGAGVNLITAEGGVMRLRSVYGSPDNVGLYLGRVAPLIAAVLLIARGAGAAGRARRLAYALAAVPVVLALALSFSRGALLLGVPAGLAAVLLLWDRRRGALALGALAVIGVPALVVLMQSPSLASRLDFTGEAARMRLNLWQSGLAMVADHPLLGVGLDNFLYAYRGHYIRPEAWHEPDLSHPHNVALDYATRLGLLGLAAGLALQAAFWRAALHAWRRVRAEPLAAALVAGLIGGMADTLAHGMVDNSYFLIDLAVVFMATLALMANLSAEGGQSG